MRYATPLSLLALAAAALAQDQTVHVGTDGKGTNVLAFTPSNITATAGSVITFVFDAVGTKHNVAQSAFAAPCAGLASGFSTDFTPGPAAAGDAPATWNLTVTDATKPIWFYCAQTTAGKAHCPAGMVGSINAPTTGNTFSAFLAAAQAATAVATPSPTLVGVEASASAFPSVAASAAGSGSGSAAASTATSASGSGTGSAAAPAKTSAPANGALASAGAAQGLVWAAAAALGAVLL